MNDNTTKRRDFWAENSAWWAELERRYPPDEMFGVSTVPCPFHDDKGLLSCEVDRARGDFYCRGCGKQGTIDDFAHEKMILDACGDAIDDGTITVIRIGGDNAASVRTLGADPELLQTGLDERRPDQWQRFGDVLRRVVSNAKSRSEH